MKEYIVNFSGGKDSTAMLHMMLDRGEDIAAVVCYDTGWEFPAMLDHIVEVEKKTGLKIVMLKPDRSYDYWMFDCKIKSQFARPEINIKRGEVYRIGNGWPAMLRRWCTNFKIQTLDRYIRTFLDPVSCIGLASDETKRVARKINKRFPVRYPLVEYSVTEKDAIEYCRKLGYTWGGLYDKFDRVSCFCCPLQGLKKLRVLRKHYPELWKRVLDMDSRILGENRGFYQYKTAQEMEKRFLLEDENWLINLTF